MTKPEQTITTVLLALACHSWRPSDSYLADIHRFLAATRGCHTVATSPNDHHRDRLRS